MPEATEAKEATEVLSDDDKMDKVLDEVEKETPSESSTEKEPEGKETETKEAPEDTTSQKSEEAKEKETEVPEEFHKHPAWQRILKERDEARGTLKETQEKGLSQGEIDQIKTVINSPEYIQTSMQGQGYKQEAIDSRLRELGHEIPEKAGDDIGLITNKLNIDSQTLDENARADMSYMAKITRVIVSDALSKALPGVIKPIQENQESILQKESAGNHEKEMMAIVKKDGVLDYEKDIVPELGKFMEKNPEAKQEDVVEFFHKMNHSLSLERLRTGKRAEDRSGKKGNQRQNTKTGEGKVELQEGMSNDEKEDAIFDAMGYNE